MSTTGHISEPPVERDVCGDTAEAREVFGGTSTPMDLIADD
jgi:hypothetical protein